MNYFTDSILTSSFSVKGFILIMRFKNPCFRNFFSRVDRRFPICNVRCYAGSSTNYLLRSGF